MPTKTIVASILITIGSLVGCGPSGRDLSDQQWLEMQEDLQAERAEVGLQRDLLEEDRRRWDEREHGEPVLAAVISSAVLLVVCGLPLLMVAILMWPRQPEPSSETVCEVLLDDVVQQSTSSDTKRLPAKGRQAKLASRKQ
ncbi:hypothetical protein [Rubripirellula reticaptiva]|uniref:Uncharacterized protein n=1 Tax=Rubripirellula reticaptiva TaxID=2528013 RepID=A0A5C6EV38_9BACT|nr:hypothetical protein [Rubripirellula reticaptiva]TWU51151.1 hypothetical protein Poly59_27410 [Rubripirellula reticaptiva]